MKVVFVSNFFNHHQKPFSDAMWKLTSGNYTFIETEKMPAERKKLGYKQHSNIVYLNSEYIKGNKKSVKKEILEADVVIAGSAPESLLKERIKKNKLTFRYSERLFKKTHGLIKNILIACKRLLYFKNNSNTYLLCASAFTARDFSIIGQYGGKYYKWGYFPVTKKYDKIDELIVQKTPNSILWCGRFLDWKHPDDVIEIANMLKKEKYDFHVNIIGTGKLESYLNKKIREYDLDNYVSLLGALPSETVREYMEKSSIYLFTSDQSEGWGAVLNEAMNSACAVVASHEIGSVPFLVKDRENAFVYKSKDIDELYTKVKYLLDNAKVVSKLGKAAYHTIVNEWNAEIAAERLLILSKHILKNDRLVELYSDGPCSKDKI